MKQILIKQGRIEVENVPAPQVEKGALLVKVKRSCISAGTEMSALQSAAQPIWKRALKNPGAVKTALKMVADRGFAHTKSVVQGKISEGNPTGYSAAGTVLEVGEGIYDLTPGDRVACAGAQCANHAEIIRVPRNLTVKIPSQNIDFASASSVTLGAIALQGIRRAQPTLGETFCVIGLGILGQITAQLLKANGCRVIGADLLPARIHLAKQLGIDHGIFPEEAEPVEAVKQLSNGHGADGVIITASTSSDEIISTAFKMCRRKGRVVLVGAVGLNLKREDFYPKELDFFISTSYGPGRYDESYEEQGNDYPYGYVRWTENRNMEEYLRMIAENKIQITPLISSTFELEKAAEAYQALKDKEAPPLIVLLSYSEKFPDKAPERVVENPMAKSADPEQVNLALIGAGAFAKGMHLPNLQAMSDKVHLYAVSSRSGPNALNTAKQFGANLSTTDNKEIFNDKNINSVLIATRHNLHASLTVEALSSGKNVLVEKPLAITNEELETIKSFYQTQNSDKGEPILLTGFNRRFSPLAKRIHELVSERRNPIVINYVMNAGYIPLDHWLHTEEGGGRNLGEACHIYDLFTFLTNSRVKNIYARSIDLQSSHYSHRDNFSAIINFTDGSLATLTYTALGSKSYPKEKMEVFFDEKTALLDDYRRLTITGLRGKDLTSKTTDKGHKQMLEVFIDAIQNRGDWPIPLWQQIQATEIALEIEKQLMAK